MLSRKKLKTESVKRAVKKAKHQPRHLRAAAQNMALRLSMLGFGDHHFLLCLHLQRL